MDFWDCPKILSPQFPHSNNGDKAKSYLFLFEYFCLLSLLLILSGGIGNLLDRTFRGYVVDFIHLYYENYSFYVFNFADTYITIGVIIYIIGMIYQYKSKENENQAS